jgi:cation transport ATPase
LGLAVGCWPILAEAWQDARRRRMSMELSMLVAIAAAAAIGEWATALLITAFVLAAEILEDLSMDRGRDALTGLMGFLPETAQVRDGGALATIPLDEVRAGQVVVIGPGGKIPVDGTVVAGESTVDASRITGEPMPVDVAAGSRVYAGSVNHVGAVEVAAERVGAGSSYGRIVDAVRHAQSSRAPAQRLADRLAAWLVYLALGGAAITFAVTRDATAAISVVVVAGACGVAAGTPLAALAAIARIAKAGAFVKDGAHLEKLSAVDTVVFDKTGTLTAGAPAVVGVQAAGMGHDRLLALAAAAESYSEHPLGRAIVAYARGRGIPVDAAQDFKYRPGLGVSARVGGHTVTAGNPALVPGAPARGASAQASAARDATARPTAQGAAGQCPGAPDASGQGPAAQGPAGQGSAAQDMTGQAAGQCSAARDMTGQASAAQDAAGRVASTAVRIGVDGAYAGTVLLADPVRDTARQAVAALRRMGLGVSMITGDQEGTARAVATQLGIDQVSAGLLPEDKVAAIRAERAAGRKVAMVGDGVNDAPALAEADVGIAMGGGTGIARETSDVILISSDLDDLVRTVAVARRARRIVMFNFAGTIAIDLAGMLLAGFGLLGPVLAAIVHVGSETAFILNSARLIPPRSPRAANPEG